MPLVLVQHALRSELVDHRIQFASYGGVGTTFLYRFLERHGLSTPPRKSRTTSGAKVGDWGKWKHMRVPPGTTGNPWYLVPDDYRAVYLFGNPMDAVVSLFRRGYQLENAKRIGGDWENWDPSWELLDYLRNGEDLYHLEDHFHQWVKCPREGRGYPILVVRYESIFDHLEEVFDFLRIPSSLRTSFPAPLPRRSDWRRQPEKIREGLEAMYGPLHDLQRHYPNVFSV